MPPNTVELFKRLLSQNLTTPRVKPLTLSQFSAPPEMQQNSLDALLTASAAIPEVTSAFNQISQPEPENLEEPGLISKFLDFASIPLYTSANVVDDLIGGIEEGQNPLEIVGNQAKSIAGGGARMIDQASWKFPGTLPLAGLDLGLEAVGLDPQKFAEENNPRTTSQEILNERFGVDNPFARYGGGLAADILLDPLTYVPGIGVVRAGARAAKAIPKVARPENLTGFRQLSPAEAIERAKAQFPSLLEPTTLKTFPDVELKTGWKSAPDDFLQQRVDRALQEGYDPEFLRGLRRFENIPPVASRGAAPVSPFRLSQELLNENLTRYGKALDPKGRVNLDSLRNVLGNLGESGRYSARAAAATGPRAERAVKAVSQYVSKGKKSINPGEQLSLFKRFVKESRGKARVSNAVAMLRTAEDTLIERGIQPTYWDGSKVRLSDILERAGHNEQVALDFATPTLANIKNPKVRAAIQDTINARSVTASEILMGLTDRAASMKQNLVTPNPVAASRFTHAQQILDDSTNLARRMGAEPKTVASAREIIKDVLKNDDLPTEVVMHQYASDLSQQVLRGQISVEVASALNREIEKLLGVKFKTLATRILDNQAIQTQMTRWTTWYGRSDVIARKTELFSWGEQNAYQRARFMRRIVKQYSMKEIQDAFRVAQGKSLEVSPKISNLAAKFIDYWDHMLGSSGMNDVLLGNTVAARSTLFMDEVNKHLNRLHTNFQFTAKSVTDSHGVTRDFTADGLGWPRSWEMWDGHDPVSLMYNMDLAIERVTKEFAMLDDFSARFGVLTKDSQHTFKIPHPRLKDYYFHENIGKQMQLLMHDIDQEIWRPNSKLIRHYASALRAWKTGVTIYLPSHHIRNLIGDTYLMWMAGYNDPRAFIRGARIIASQRSRYNKAYKAGDFEELSKLTSKDAMKWSETRGGDVILNRNGIQLTADQIYIAAHQHGLLPTANQLEDIFGEAAFGGKLKPFGGKVHGAAAHSAEAREHFVRVSHFTAAIEKRLKKGDKNLQRIYSGAASEVRKWHPDGRDLARVEQNLRLAMPFYSWTRKSIPLLVQSAVTRPAKVLFYPRAMLAVQGMMGIEGGTLLDPFPDDQLFPDWIRAYGIGPVLDEEQHGFWGNLGNVIPSGYTVVNPSNPTIDAFGQFAGPGNGVVPDGPIAGLLDMLSPALRIPAELATGHKVTGAPISNDPTGYVAENIPILAPFARVTNSIIPGRLDTKQAEDQQSNFDLEALLNLLALGYRNTGPYIDVAQFEEKERAKNVNR